MRAAGKFAVLALCLVVAGCLSSSSKPAPPPAVYVTPCNVIGKGIQVRIPGELKPDNIKLPLQEVLVDNFKSPAAIGMRASFQLECSWGYKVGERRDLYYCTGRYKAPELDENQVIKRWIWKEFKLGFSVEAHDIGSWVDSRGNIQPGGKVNYITTKTVDATCTVM